MDRDAESLLDQPYEVLEAQLRLPCERLPQRRHHIRRNLVGPPRSGLLGQQRRQASRRVGRLHLVVRRSRQAEARRAVADRLPVYADPAQHLVLDLHQVARVEELARGECLVGDLLRMRVQAALLAEGVGLGVALGSGHGRSSEQM
ncbi:MAG: hypothetical protein QME77_13440 [bacterium]|nr:hypothetical protein [bacterium]